MKSFLFLILVAISYGQQELFGPGNSAYYFSGAGNLGHSYFGNGVPQQTPVQRSTLQPQYPLVPQSTIPQYNTPQYNAIPAAQSPNGGAPLTSASIEGAVYFMTNDPRGNSIISTSIQQGGQMGFSTTFPTGGTGGYNIPQKKEPGSPDPLASQNSLIVGEDSLFAVNAGSNSVSMFSINRSNPTELVLRSHVASGGEFPVAMAYSPALGMLCVLNAGTQNGVQCFSSKGGTLALLPQAFHPLGLRSSTPSRELGSVSDIIFTPDSSQLLVSVKGNPDPVAKGFIASLRIQGDRITNAELSIPHEKSVTPWGMSIVPGTGVTTDPIVIFTDPFGKGFGIATMGKRTSTILASNMIEIPEQEETCWTSFSPRSGTLFTTDSATNTVTESSIDIARHSARILNQYPLAKSSSPIDASMASLGDKDVLYVLSSGDQSIQALGLLGPGQAYLLQQYFPSRGNPGITLNTGLQGLATYVIR